MKNISKIRSLFILISVLIGLVYAMPNFINFGSKNVSYSFLPGKKINLGLDLKGGSYLLLQADMKIVFEEKLEDYYQILGILLENLKLDIKN